MSTWQNPGQAHVASGLLDLTTIMGISNNNWVVNGNGNNFLTALSDLSFNKFTQNSYDNTWTKGIKVQQMGNTGSVVYTFTPAILPVSNFTQSDLGNRSFGTQMNVVGKNIMYLQTNFWTNEFTALTSKKYMESIQKQLIGTYSRSISMIKTELSILENTLFCLATAQFWITDAIGRKVLNNPNNPNTLNAGSAEIFWGAQSPRLMSKNDPFENSDRTFLQHESDNISSWLMLFPLSINQFNIGYSAEKLTMICSYYMRNNLAHVLQMGWPTDTNKKEISEKSYTNAYISQWFNLLLTDTNTIPYFQNDIGMVSAESMGTNANGTYTGQPLGYGINNVCDFSYTRNIVAMTSFEGAIDQYYTTNVPFNPYNIDGAKTWYRLGYMWGWGQVHVPDYWGVSYMFLDNSSYMKIFSIQKIDGSWTTDYDWTNVADASWFTGSGMTLTFTDFNGTTNTGVSYNYNSASYDNPMLSTTTASSSYPAQCSYIDGLGNPYFCYAKVVNGTCFAIFFGFNISQMLDDMTQAQAILLNWEPGMGYDRYCFPNLPTDISDTLSYTVNPNSTAVEGQIASVGNSCGLTFAQWAGLRDINCLGATLSVTNENNTIYSATNTSGGNTQTSTSVATVGQALDVLPINTYPLMDLVKIGWNQLYLQPYQWRWNMPNDLPYITDTGYSNTPSSNSTTPTWVPKPKA